MAYYLIFTGQGDEAINWSLKAMRTSPLFPPSSYQEAMGMSFMVASRYEEAVKWFFAVSSAEYYVHVYAAGCLAKLGRTEEARIQSRMAFGIRQDWNSLSGDYKYDKDKKHMDELIRLATNALQD